MTTDHLYRDSRSNTTIIKCENQKKNRSKMSYSIFLLFSGLICVLLMFLPQSTALSCFECNSHNDSRCHDKIPPDVLKVECPTSKQDHNYILCRKITQIIEFEVNGLPPDTRTIRACGWDDSSYKNRCYQRSGFGGRQEVCACETDFCNSAPMAMTATAVPLTLVVIALVKWCM